MDRIHQEIVLKGSPADVYAVLTDASRFSEMSGGAPAEIDASDGGALSLFGGMIEGRNVECRNGERLVQAWRAKNWEDGVYSIVRFALEKDGENTRVTLDHTGYPEGQGEHLDKGWHANYWEPLEALLG